MSRRDEWTHQCQTCGGIVRARERRTHLREEHPDVAASTVRQVAAMFTTTIDLMHPGRAAKWDYSDADICVVIPGLQAKSAADDATPEQESSDG